MVVNEIISTAVVSNIASATGQGAGISANYATGLGNVATAYPMMGKVKGTSMTLKAVKKLKNPIKSKIKL